MRFPLILIAALIAAPAYSQRVFRASSLEEASEQLDKQAKAIESVDRQIKNLDRDVRYTLNTQNDWITKIGELQSHAEQSRYRTEKAIESLTKRMETLEQSVANQVSLPGVPDPVPSAPADSTSDGELAAAPERPASVRPSPASRLPRSYIVKETLDGCVPCVVWDRGPRSAIEAIGWTVIDEQMTDPGGMAPRFRVVVSGKEYRHQGPLTFGDLHRIMDRHNGVGKKPAPRPASQSYATSELSASINAYRPGGWRGAVYRGVNEQRMSVYTHLTRDHGFSQQQVNGLSHDEALILHDNQHGPVNQRISPVRRDNLVSLPVESQQQVGCALGGCAVQSTVNYSNNSNGWYLGKNLGR